MARLLRSTAAAISAILFAAGLSGHAQQPAPPPGTPPASSGGQPAAPADPQQPPVFRTGINFVRVDVIVSDKNGNPVADLKPEDFEITEQRTPQKIETFKLISLDGGLMSSVNEPPRQIRTDADEENEAARDDVRLFAIFLDDYHVRVESSMVARQQIARFVETQLGPTDMVGLMRPLQPTASVRMTRNHDAISRGIQQFVGRKFDYRPTNEMEERYAYYPAEVVEKIRNQVSMSAIQALILRMGALKEGRKALILVSEGYNAMLPPQMRDSIAAMPGSGNLSTNDPFAGDRNNPLEDRARFSANADMDSDLRNLWDLANKNNVAIYAVDPRGLSTGEFGIDQNISGTTDRAYLNSTMETLRTLAINTDGRAIINRNDLTMGMKQIVRDQSAYYLLGYSSTFAATDGKFHEIKVSVKRPGVQVRARRGYWAFTAADAARATAPAKPAMKAEYSTALGSLATPRGSRVARTWVGLSKGDSGKTRVTFVWEPAPKTPGTPVRQDDTPARVSLMAIGVDGSPFFRGRVPAVAPATAATAGARVTFDVPPGKIQLRASIENGANDVLDTENRELEIPDLTAPQVVFGTPVVFRARTLRDYQQAKGDPQAAPTTGRDFSRTERVFVRVPVYGPGTEASPVTARILNRGAEPMGDVPVSVSSLDPAIREIELSLAPMSTGDYLLEIVAASGGQPVTAVLGFRVTP